MSLDMARKGIDFLFSHSMDAKLVDIGFYGGEPLLQFGMIKDLAQYAKEQGEGKKLSFNMTTNGTIMSDEIVEFLSVNNFNVMISLDGPKNVHDKNRVFAANGKGSFDTIMKNISYIRANHPIFYSKISFSTVIDPQAENSCSNNFFLNCAEIKGIPVMAGMVSDEYRSEPISIPEHFLVQDEKDTFHMLLYKLGRLTDETVPQITQDKFNQLSASMFFQRQHAQHKLPSRLHHSGPCIPGVHKLFMDIYGSFFPCEKVSEGSSNAIIGNIEHGFDLNNVIKLLNIGMLTEKECKTCWNILLCSQCVISADDIDGLSKEKKLRACAKSKRVNDKLLKDYCTLLEYGYRFTNNEIPLVDFTEE